MKQFVRMIYMLSQCKDAIDNPVALFARMRRRKWRELRGQSGACSSSDVITSGGRKSETTMEDKLIVVVCGYPELYDITLYFYKNRNKKDLAWKKVTRPVSAASPLHLLGRSPSHDANSRLCSEFHVRMKRVNSKFSSVQLRAIYSRHSRLVWNHLMSS